MAGMIRPAVTDKHRELANGEYDILTPSQVTCAVFQRRYKETKVPEIGCVSITYMG